MFTLSRVARIASRAGGEATNVRPLLFFLSVIIVTSFSNKKKCAAVFLTTGQTAWRHTGGCIGTDKRIRLGGRNGRLHLGAGGT